MKKSPLEHEQEYVEFLKRKLASKNFQSVATKKEIDLVKEKYDKAKFRLKMLKNV